MSYLQRAKKVNELDFKNITVIMGRPGSGKSTLMGTFPKPIFDISIGNDDGEQVLQEHGDDVSVLRVDSKEDTIGVLKEILKEQPDDFKTIALDAISTVQEDEELVKSNAKNGAQLNFDDWRDIKGTMFEIYQLAEDIAKIKKDDGTLKYEIVIISHVKTKEETDLLTGGDFEKLIPLLTENNGTRLLKNAKNVWYIQKLKKKTPSGKLTTEVTTYLKDHPHLDLKTRTASVDASLKLPQSVVNLTYDKYIELITDANGEVKKETKKPANKTAPKKEKVEEKVEKQTEEKGSNPFNKK